MARTVMLQGNADNSPLGMFCDPDIGVGLSTERAGDLCQDVDGPSPWIFAVTIQFFLNGKLRREPGHHRMILLDHLQLMTRNRVMDHHQFFVKRGFKFFQPAILASG